ncbi:MAG: DUF4143 domain-containing protein, partial [Mycoplasmataceae bacterium]|nr:DUF4143 domain-containing protein [Mycoplasmataceae bacterium]
AQIGGLGLIIPNIDNIELAKEDLSDVLKDTIEKDVKKKHSYTRNILIDKTIKYALNNIGKTISVYKTTNNLNKNSPDKINHVSLNKYLQWGVDAMLLIRVDYWNNKTNTILETSGKYYGGDIGLVNTVIGYEDSSFGYKLENIVLLQLIFLKWEVYTLKIYQKNTDNREIDFVIKKGTIIKYIQVTHTLDEKNKVREIGNLLKIRDGFEKICIFLINNSSFSNDGIRRVDLVRWLLGEIEI